MKQQATISFYGGAGTVTGSHFLFSSGDTRIAIDCGLFQGTDEIKEKNHRPFAYSPGSLDAVVITHGHLDHIGRVPKLVAEGFTGPIYSTAPTKDLATLLFEDTLSIMEHRASKGDDTPPLYTKDAVRRALWQWQTVPYHEDISVGDISFALKDAGHILGSAMAVIAYKESHIVFTGDVGGFSPLLRKTESLMGATYIVTESVYGDREHESGTHRQKKLEDLVERIIRRKGTMLIPAFSIERTQTLLSELNTLVERGRVPALPVFLDSPLAIKVTELYKKYDALFNTTARKTIAGGDDIFAFPNLTFTETVEDSKKINTVSAPKIIIAGSGMSTGGRVLHHEKHYLPKPENMIVFVGHQAVGTRGRKILDGASSITIDEKNVPVRAQVHTLFGYSAHKDSDGLLDLVTTAGDDLRRVFVALGEPASSFFFAQRLRDYLGIDAVVPEDGQTYALDL